MRILVIQPFGKFNGHYSTYTMLLAKGLADSGAEFDVLSFDGFVENWPQALGLNHITAGKTGSRRDRFVNKYFGERWPAWFLKTFTTARWAFARASQYRALHFVDATWTVTLLLWFLYGAPGNLVITIGGAGNVEGTNEAVPWSRSFRDWLEFKALKHWVQRGIRTIVHSEGVQNWLVDNGVASATNNNVRLIPWGVILHEDLPTRERARQAIGYGGYAGELFLFFGHVRPVKGIEDFIEAVRDLPKNFKVLIVGAAAPGYDERIRKAIESIGWESEFDLRLRFVPFDEIALYHRACNVAMLNYRSFLGASGVLSHALEFYLPVIASDYGQIGDLVKKGGFGLLCEPGSVSSLTGSIQHFLTTTEAEREVFCRHMKSYADSHSWAAIGREHARVYDSSNA